MAAIMPASGGWFPTARGGGLGADQQLAPSTYTKFGGCNYTHVNRDGGTGMATRQIVAVLIVGALSCATRIAEASECKEHVELHSGAHWAKELGRTEAWVLANHQINVWQRPSPDKGNTVGKMRVGSKAVILRKSESDYQIKSPLDGSPQCPARHDGVPSIPDSSRVPHPGVGERC